jgi:hypothetical protein
MNQNEIVEALLAAARGVVVARYPEKVEPLWAGLEPSLRDAAVRLVRQAVESQRRLDDEPQAQPQPQPQTQARAEEAREQERNERIKRTGEWLDLDVRTRLGVRTTRQAEELKKALADAGLALSDAWIVHEAAGSLQASGDSWSDAYRIAAKSRARLQQAAKEMQAAKSAQVKEAQAEPQAQPQAQAQTEKALGLKRGNSVEAGTVRIHRYADSLQITDLANAGKRGKTVKVLDVSPSFMSSTKNEEWIDGAARTMIGLGSYDAIKSFAEEAARNLLAEAVNLPSKIRLSETERRGVDVNAAGTEKIQISSPYVEITALPDSFSLLRPRRVGRADLAEGTFLAGRGGAYYEETMYREAGKRDADLFYAWLKQNRAQAQRMTLNDFKVLWNELGVQYDSH